MFLEPQDEELIAWGWPWHGLARTTITGSGYETTITAATAEVIEVPRFIDDWRWTYIFDAGLPDVPDPAVEAEGGAWWGRAILRAKDGLAEQWAWGSGWYAIDFGSGFEPGNFRLPLWWEPEEGEPVEPLQVVFQYSGSGSSHTLRLSRLGRFINGGDGSAEASLVVSVSDLQQASGPVFAAKTLSESPTWRQVTPGEYEGMGLEFHNLGIWENKILLGLIWRVSIINGRPVLPHPIMTSPGSGGSSPGGAPVAYSGLIELVVDPVMLDPAGDYSDALSINVVESLTTALGNAQHNYSDETDPDDARTVIDERIETSGLLTAWYDSSGTIRTARYNRTQLATFVETVVSGISEKNQTRIRRTELDLLFGGTVVDSRFLQEEFQIINESPTRWTVRNTISETGKDDDITESEDVGYDSTSIYPTYTVGSHLAVGTPAQIYSDGLVDNVLDYQDVRLLWIAPSSNNVASLSRSQEPYDYPEDQDYMMVSVYSGPAVGPLGVVGSPVSREITRGKTSPGNFWRGFFSTVGQKWVWATGNPVTGAVVRANSYYDEPDTFFDWV